MGSKIVFMKELCGFPKGNSAPDQAQSLSIRQALLGRSVMLTFVHYRFSLYCAVSCHPHSWLVTPPRRVVAA